MPATINDVAKLSKVSVGSISRYLNGINLKPENMKKVKEAIDILDYKQNIIAKSLKCNKTMVIGILINSLTDIFSVSIVEAAEKILIAHNYTILLCNYNLNINNQEQKLRYLLDKKIDGAILYLTGEYLPILNDFIESNTPFVLVNQTVNEISTDSVLVDNEKAGLRAVSKLLSCNHKRIGIICGFQDDPTSIGRLNGYRKAHANSELEIDEDLIQYGKYDCKTAYNATKKLLELPNPPTALFAVSYHMTLGMMIALNEMDIKIPDDMSVIGFDHFELSDVIKPPLSLVEQPMEQMGIVASQILLKRLSGDYNDYPIKKVLDTTLCIRNSIKNI